MTPAERNERRRRQLDRVRIMARAAQLEHRAKEHLAQEQKEVDELVKRQREEESVK
jgi:exonuclease VII small subunit